MSKARTEPRSRDFDVRGMTCGSCAARVQRVLGKQPGVAEAEVNFATGKARVVPDDGELDVEALCKAVEKIGYGLARTGRRPRVRQWRRTTTSRRWSAPGSGAW